MKIHMTAWKVLEEWRSNRFFEALLDGVERPGMVPNPNEVRRELMDFVTLAGTNCQLHLWRELCAVIDRYGDAEKMRLWFLAGGKERFSELLHGDPSEWPDGLIDPGSDK